MFEKKNTYTSCIFHYAYLGNKKRVSNLQEIIGKTNLFLSHSYFIFNVIKPCFHRDRLRYLITNGLARNFFLEAALFFLFQMVIACIDLLKDSIRSGSTSAEM